jgi:hypothetical protein
MIAPPSGNHAYLPERVKDVAIDQLVVQAGMKLSMYRSPKDYLVP